jgi:soluble lytic murein transglycosylase-like protein
VPPPQAVDMPMSEPSLPDPSHLQAPPPQALRPIVSDIQRKRAYVRYIVRNYRVEPELAQRIVSASYSAGGTFRVKPPLLLGVIAVESSFNPNAFNGVDMGLMQVNPAYHPEKIARIGGAHRLFDVDKNIYVGAWVLRQFIDATRSESNALLRYSGSQRFGRDYPVRVAAQRQALEREAEAWSAATPDAPVAHAPVIVKDDEADEPTFWDWLLAAD